MKQTKDIKRIAVIGMLCALAYLVSLLFHFKISFLTFDLKDAVLAVAALLYGPLSGVCAALVAALLELVTISDTGLYGFIMNFLASGTFALVCGLLYKYHRSFSGAVLALVFAAASTVCVMLLANWGITPYYLVSISKDATATVSAQRSLVVSMIPTLFLPFNLCKSVLCASVTMLIYKPVTLALRRMGVVSSAPAHAENWTRFALTAVVSALLIMAILLVFFLRLQGSVEVFTH